VPREPKVVDVEPVAEGWSLRRVLGLLLLVALAAGLWVAYRRIQTTPPTPPSAEAGSVRSTVYRSGDSLEVAVAWELMIDSLRTAPESIRIEVGLSGGEQASVATQSAARNSDTLRVAAPTPGHTASGYSCVAPIHRGQIRRESCTPWQFVVPAADTAPTIGASGDTTGRPARGGKATSPSGIVRIVVQPAGLQVDPDIDGRCARWQRNNPGQSVWIEVNREAIPQCTGANGKPTVAQFCAFAELGDGRRVLTENSSNNVYCDRLYREWAGERVS
jgi:hypothetical protein